MGGLEKGERHYYRVQGGTPFVFFDLAIPDIKMAADVLRPVYERSEAVDGYVSFEVEPRLARDAEGTIAAAREAWTRLDRPNVLIKVPGTDEGLIAIETLISDELWPLPKYRELLFAY